LVGKTQVDEPISNNAIKKSSGKLYGIKTRHVVALIFFFLQKKNIEVLIFMFASLKKLIQHASMLCTSVVNTYNNNII
jgi:hypothetical protein